MKTVALLAIAGIAAAANAGFTATGAGPYASNGPINSAANGSFTYNHAGPAFRSGSFTFNGLATKVNSGTFASEMRLQITNAAGQTFNTTTALTGAVASSSWTTYTATNLNFGLSGTFAAAANSVGTWTFKFYESFDDGGTSSVDANWTNVSFQFNDFVPPPPPAVIENLGDNSTWGSVITRSGSIVNGGVNWYQFGVSSPQSFTDIWTSVAGATALDTEIGLYNSDGELVATNDDATGLGFRSRLGFGAGSQLTVWDSGTSAVLGATSPGTATATPLAAGTYYLAVAGFNSTFGAGGFAVTGGTAVGDYGLNLIPTPGSVALLGLGGLAAARRRR